MAVYTEKVRSLRNMLEEGILARTPGCRLNGPKEGRLPNNCSLTFDGIDGEALLLRLDLAGIAGSAGSACTSGSRLTSHVLKAVGLTDDEARGTLRLTPGPGNTQDEIAETIQTVCEIVEDLRRLSRGQ